jgi:anti-sigma factor RsiW
MSDDIDPQLLRSFANAREPLADAQFHERVMNHLQRARKSRGLAENAWSAALTLLAGLGTAVRAPFRMRIGVTGVLTIVFGAIVSVLALLTA